MKNSKMLKIALLVILTLVMLFSCNVAKADNVQEDLENWAKGFKKNDDMKLSRFRYKANGKVEYRYAMRIKSPKKCGVKHIVRTPYGSFYMQVMDGDKIVKCLPIKITAQFYVEDVGGRWYSETDNAQTVFTTSKDSYVVVESAMHDPDSYTVTYKTGCVDTDYFTKNLDIWLTLKCGDVTLTDEPLGHKTSFNWIEGWLDTHGEDIWTRLKEIIEAFFNFLRDIMARIINFILLNIAKGIHALINYAVGEDVSLHKIIFGYSKKFTIDFWNVTSGDGTSIAGVMKPVISYWYISFRSIAIACYLILLLYLGIKMLLSNNATRLEDIKERLNIWLSGVLILLFFPIIMRYIYVINEVAVKAVEQRGLSGAYDPDHSDLMDDIRKYCTNEDQSNIPLTICYMIMLGELILLIIAYYKRAFMVGFLITFFPVVCIKHLFDGINVNGKGHALGAWLKEYCSLVFVQLIHAVIYSVLIEGASEVFAFNDEGDGNVILYLLFISFLFKAEGIAKSIFQIDSNNGLLFNMANGGAAALAFGKQAVGGIKDMTHKKESSHDKEDQKEEKEFTNKRREIESSRSASSVRESGHKMDEANSSVKETTDKNNKEASDLKQTNGSPTLTPEGVQASGKQGEGEGEGKQGEGAPKSDDEYIAENLEKAKAVIGERAMKKRNGSYDHKRRPGAGNAVKTFTKNLGRAGLKTIRGVAGFGVKATAMGVGLAAGAASGNLTKGLEYGVALSKTAGLATSAARRGGDWAGRKFKASRLKSEFNKKDSRMMQDLQDAGVDTDALFNNKKGEMIKKALEEYASGMVRGGKTLANKNYTYEILKDSLSKTEETKDKK